METYLVELTGVNQKKKFMENVLYTGENIEAAKASADQYKEAVYLHVWNGGILVRTYIKMTVNFGRDIRWKLVRDYLHVMKLQALELEKKLGKITEVTDHRVGHKDDGEGGFYL